MNERPEDQPDWSFVKPADLGQDVIILARRTSLVEAVEIARTGIYRPQSCDPALFDSGLNAFVADRPGVLSQAFASDEVWLVLYWRGPEQESDTFPLPPNTLCVQLPWRVVVPLGSDANLTIAGVSASEADWRNYEISYPWFCRVWPLKSWYRKRAASEGKARLEKAIDEARPIRVGAKV